jgi:hypothetical protein
LLILISLVASFAGLGVKPAAGHGTIRGSLFGSF